MDEKTNHPLKVTVKFTDGDVQEREFTADDLQGLRFAEDDGWEADFTDDDIREVVERLHAANLHDEFAGFVLQGAVALLETTLESFLGAWGLVAEWLPSVCRRMTSWLAEDMMDFGIKRKTAKRLAPIASDFACQYAERKAKEQFEGNGLESEDNEDSGRILELVPLTDITV